MTIPYVNIALLFTPLFFISTFDFGEQKDGNNWVVINDGVMGGLSTGKAVLKENSILFTGKISFANNGGFASLRSNRTKLNTSEVEFIEIKYRLTGLSFSFILEQDYRFYMPYFSHPLEITEGEWSVLRIPIDSFYETRLGNYTGYRLGENSSRNIFRLGFISRDKKAQDYELEIDYINVGYRK